MIFERLIVFFKTRLINAANKTKIMFVLFNVLSLVSKLCKLVNHDTRHNVGEKKCKENKVYRVEEKLYWVPIDHLLSNDPWGWQGDHTTDEGRAIFRVFLLFVNVVDIVMEWNNGENVLEKHSQHRDHEELFIVSGNRLKHILQQWKPSNHIEQMQR